MGDERFLTQATVILLYPYGYCILACVYITYECNRIIKEASKVVGSMTLTLQQNPSRSAVRIMILHDEPCCHDNRMILEMEKTLWNILILQLRVHH